MLTGSNETLKASYGHQRDRLQATVCAVVSECDELLQLSGSFRFGDFHLDAFTRRSWSDVDIIAVGAPAHLRAELGEAITRGIAQRTGRQFRVSLHPGDGFRLLSEADARFLAIGEFLRYCRRSTTDYRNFLLAKISLLVLRQRQTERYLDVARRIGTPDAVLAGRVKIGISSRKFDHAAMRLLRASPYPEATLMEHAVLAAEESTEIFRWYASQLRQRQAIDPWLRNYVAGEVERAAGP
jgi:hypothetical protein